MSIIVSSDSLMDQREVLLEVVVAVENAVAAGCSKANMADNSKWVVVGEGVPVEAESAGIAAVVEAALSKILCISKVVQVETIKDSVAGCNVEVDDNDPRPPKWLPLAVVST